MGENDSSGEESGTKRSDTRDEVRTIAFRLREIQRLLSMRVQQENRRLEADGIAPVAEATFFKPIDDRTAHSTTSSLVKTLAGMEIFETARLTLADGTTIQGRVNPITYTPNDRLWIEIRPRDENARYELRATHRDGQWTTPVVRRYAQGNDDWTELGELATIQVGE
jgi:hypothetical protein